MLFKTPEDVGESIRRKAPASWKDILWNVGVILAWYNLLASLIGAIKDTAFVVRCVGWVVRHSYVLGPFISWCWEKVHGLVEWWRHFAAPIRNLIRMLVPVDLSEEAVDLILFFVSAVPLLLRYIFVSSVYSSSRARHARVLAEANERAREAADQAEEAARASENAKKSRLVANQPGAAAHGIGWLQALLILFGVIKDPDEESRKAAEDAERASEEAAEAARQAQQEADDAARQLSKIGGRRKQSVTLLIVAVIVIVLVIVMLTFDKLWGA